VNSLFSIVKPLQFRGATVFKWVSTLMGKVHAGYQHISALRKEGKPEREKADACKALPGVGKSEKDSGEPEQRLEWSHQSNGLSRPPRLSRGGALQRRFKIEEIAKIIKRVLPGQRPLFDGCRQQAQVIQ
jgi:hypothetical protein